MPEHLRGIAEQQPSAAHYIRAGNGRQLAQRFVAGALSGVAIAKRVL